MTLPFFVTVFKSSAVAKHLAQQRPSVISIDFAEDLKTTHKERMNSQEAKR